VPKTPRLREWRARAALSQEELHDLSGVSRATIADLEAGKRGAQPRTIRKLAEALDVEPDHLYGGPEHPLGQAPPSPEQPPLNGFEEERRHRPLRNWTGLINDLADRWEQEIAEREHEWQAAKPSIRKNVRLLPDLRWANEIRQTSSAVLRGAFLEFEAALTKRAGADAAEHYKSVRRLQEVLEQTHAWYRRGTEDDAPKVAEIVDIREAVQRMERKIGSQAS
jgi:transcriptional regulator with XRE-family HTH domain